LEIGTKSTNPSPDLRAPAPSDQEKIPRNQFRDLILLITGLRLSPGTGASQNNRRSGWQSEPLRLRTVVVRSMEWTA
jgi:hypothetical protein